MGKQNQIRTGHYKTVNFRVQGALRTVNFSFENPKNSVRPFNIYFQSDLKLVN